MRVAIVHDDLVQWGGAERVLLGLCEIFPDAPIYTSVFDYSNNQLAKRFANKNIITSFLQKIPGWKSLYKAILPLYPIAFEQFNFDEYDLVISHTTRFAKSIITKPKSKHICYCHTPPRFLWRFSGEGNYGPGEVLMTKLRLYDQVSSKRVDHFIAGSKNAQRRIKKVYGQDSKVLYPFIDLDRFNNIESFDGGYYLVISRLNRYKKVDLAVSACLKLGFPLKIIGTGPELENLRKMVDHHQNVEFLGQINDNLVVRVLSGCKALIVSGIEDFGLIALEAQALGKPVIAYKEGGCLETVIEGKTGLFFNYPSVESLMKTLKRFNDPSTSPGTGLNHFDRAICKENAKQFSKEIFINNFQQTIDILV